VTPLIDRPRNNPAGFDPWLGLVTLNTNVVRMKFSVYRSAAGVYHSRDEIGVAFSKGSSGVLRESPLEIRGEGWELRSSTALRSAPCLFDNHIGFDGSGLFIKNAELRSFQPKSVDENKSVRIIPMLSTQLPVGRQKPVVTHVMSPTIR